MNKLFTFVAVDCQGTAKVRSIALSSSKKKKKSIALPTKLTDEDIVQIRNVKLTPQAFTGMHNLRFLKIEAEAIRLDDKTCLESLPDSLRYLYWHSYPWKSLPSKFSPTNLVEIGMPSSKLQRLWNKVQVCV